MIKSFGDHLNFSSKIKHPPCSLFWFFFDTRETEMITRAPQFWFKFSDYHFNFISKMLDPYREAYSWKVIPIHVLHFSAGIEESHRKGKIASLIGVEGGHSIGTSLSVLRMFYQLGARYLTVTHTCNTPWADCCKVDEPGQVPHIGGLSHFGTVSNFPQCAQLTIRSK